MTLSLKAAELDTKDKDKVKATFQKTKDAFNKSKADIKRVLGAHDQNPKEIRQRGCQTRP